MMNKNNYLFTGAFLITLICIVLIAMLLNLMEVKFLYLLFCMIFLPISIISFNKYFKK